MIELVAIQAHAIPDDVSITVHAPCKDVERGVLRGPASMRIALMEGSAPAPTCFIPSMHSICHMFQFAEELFDVLLQTWQRSVGGVHVSSLYARQAPAG